MAVQVICRFDVRDGDLRNILSRLNGIPQKLQNQTLRAAGKKAMTPVMATAKALTPYGTKAKGVIDMRHMRDTITMKIARYTRKKAAAFAFIVGPESPQVNHAHLVESGTKPRYTRHTTRYRNVAGRRVRVAKPVRFGNGRWSTKKVERNFNTRVSVGSFRDYKKLGKPKYTGVMPAFEPMQRAWAQKRFLAHLILEREINKGIAKAAKGSP